MVTRIDFKLNDPNAEPERVWAPDDAYEYLRAIYRGEIEPDPRRMRAAEKCMEFERPKPPTTAYHIVDDGFAARLDRAIARSQGPVTMNQIEHQPNSRQKEV
jgi:hypothetical protein